MSAGGLARRRGTILRGDALEAARSLALRRNAKEYERVVLASAEDDAEVLAIFPGS